jgi:hypothetical protein
VRFAHAHTPYIDLVFYFVAFPCGTNLLTHQLYYEGHDVTPLSPVQYNHTSPLSLADLYVNKPPPYTHNILELSNLQLFAKILFTLRLRWLLRRSTTSSHPRRCLRRRSSPSGGPASSPPLPRLSSIQCREGRFQVVARFLQRQGLPQVRVFFSLPWECSSGKRGC